jgi:hypothetical protein
MKFPAQLENPKQTGGIIVYDSQDLRESAKTHLGLSPGFIESCSDEELLQVFVSQGWSPCLMSR